MMNRDYNADEINNVCETLINEHYNKLKTEEKIFVDTMRNINRFQHISQHDRDILIGMFDRLQGDEF